MGTAVIVVLSIIIFLLFAFSFVIERIGKWSEKPDAEYVLRFLKEHKEKSSVCIYVDGQISAYQNPDVPMPLASTVKIIVAVTYAEQAASGKCNPDEPVLLEELEKFYVQGTDGGAQEAWLHRMNEQGIISENAVPLKEVAKGMIEFSSNANTEYLLMRLGLKQINGQLEKLGFTGHTPIYPFVSSLFIGYELLRESGSSVTDKEAVKLMKKTLKGLSDKEWRERAADIHRTLQKTGQDYIRSAQLGKWYDAEIDRMQSERFIKGTAREYADLMQKINSRTFFDPSVQEHLHPLLEWIMENPGNQTYLVHSGKKGGSTRYILTDALYAENLEGTQIAAAIFFYPLDLFESRKLASSLNLFERNVLKDQTFREKVIQAISSERA